MTGRLPRQPGEWIDRDAPVRFRFEGKEYTGLAGDTVSSALWAAGVRLLGRSFKYHRPRGIFSLSDSDSNVLVQCGGVPNLRADVTPISDGMDLTVVNTSGGVDRDRLSILDRFGKLTPVGFYYKAFHTPRALFPLYEGRIRALAGLGSIPEHAVHRPTPKECSFCDVLVVGAGPAGLAAATTAAAAGARVMLVESDRRPGGTLGYQCGDDDRAAHHLTALLGAVQSTGNLEVRWATTAVGYFADHWIALVDELKLTKLRARAVVVATGCREQPAVFRNNDLPGVMLASAAQRLIHRYAVPPCSRAVVLTANDDGYRAALDVRKAGIEVAAVLDLRANRPPSEAAASATSAGLAVYPGLAIYEALPDRRKIGVRGVTVCPLDDHGDPMTGAARELACDAVLMSVGWAPADELLRQAGGRMEYHETLHQFVPGDLPGGVFAAGRVNGVYELDAQIRDGRRAGLAACATLGIGGDRDDGPPPRDGNSPNHPYPIVRHPMGKEFVDFDEDLQVQDVLNAIQEGFDSPELLKRYATVGMGPSQGKHSNLLALRILARQRTEPMTGMKSTTARPYTSPVPLRHLAGRGFTAIRRTPTHSFHVARGAKLMYAGNWLRPQYYPIPGLTRDECIEAEALSVRTAVGLIDLGTLGGIDVMGPNAAELLSRVYTGAFAKLKTGGSRYGVMCDESGVVIDDGVICRIADDRFYFTTTTTGSDAVYRRLLWWLVQWRLDVVLANTTSSFGAMNLAGPRSRDLLQTLTSASLADEDFPYVAMREFEVAGVPSRVKRVGFVGELGYEIHSVADGTTHVWDAIIKAGECYGIRPFGVEAQRLLRLEKGHIIVGHDTDGLTDPYEAASGWAVRMNKEFFVGQRSLQILEGRQRKRQLVGFVLADGARHPVPKECHLVVDRSEIVGRVTSAAYSPTVGRVIGLAYVPPAKSEPGSTFTIKVERGRIVTATVVELPFYDPGNTRQTGGSTVTRTP